MEKKPEAEEIGTVISTLEGPSPSSLDFVVYAGKIHRGQYIELDYTEGTLVALVTDVVKANRYFERVESVKEFESAGSKLFEQFPASEWEYLVAKTRPLGVYSHEGLIKRSTFPPSPGAKVRVASKKTLENFLGLDLEKGLMLGEIEHHGVSVKLNLSRLFQKHLAILAMSGAGKCVSPDTKIFLDGRAQKTIGEIVDAVLEKNKRIEDGVEFWEEDFDIKSYGISTVKGAVNPGKIYGYYRRKAPEKMIKIKTRTGRELEVTAEHMVPVFAGRIEWKQAQQISGKDYLFLPRIAWVGTKSKIDFTSTASKLRNVVCENGYAMQKQSKLSTRLTHDVDVRFARFMAYLIAEGHNTLKSRINFSNENPLIQADFAGICKEKFGLAVKRAKPKEELLIDSVVLARCLNLFGFTNSSWTKFIPDEILQSETGVLQNFISVFLDCDGYVNPSKPEVDITVASKRLADGLEEMLSKLGVVALRRIKTVDGEQYQRVVVSGSGEIRKLGGLNLLIDYKKSALDKWARTKPNTNIDVVPNLHPHFQEILSLLRMPQPQQESPGIINYLSRKDNPSRESLRVLIGAFEKRAGELENTLAKTNAFLQTIPHIPESDALELVKTAHAEGFYFKQISAGSGVSSTTARRVVRQLTFPTNTVFLLARNVLKSRGQTSAALDAACSVDRNKLLSEIKALCEALGHSTEELCRNSGSHERFLYEHSMGRGEANHSVVLAFADSLKKLSEEAFQHLAEARARISVLKQFCQMNVFFDSVRSVQKIRPHYKYVYDLSVEDSNFVANGIVIHNSYLVSVLLEELLERKKEDGRLAVIVMDAHGEYSSFAEPPMDSKHKDFSSKTRFVKASEIKIGVPKLSTGALSAILPELSPAQKRDLAKVIEQLNAEMKSGLGPFDFAAVKSEIVKDNDMKDATKQVLLGLVLSLEQLRLFAKTDNPSINDLVRPGQLTVIDLSDVIEMRKKQIIVAYFASKLFNERRRLRVPPFCMVLEESHQFAPEKVSRAGAISRGIIETIAREGRKFGASVCLISQRPAGLSTTALSQCNTHIILRVTNPYDLDHIKQTSEGIDQRTLDMITSLRTGEAIIVGEAVNYPVFLKVRKRLSQESRHEKTLEKAALEFEEAKEEARKDIEDLL
ncbi:MAG TPA: DUF87 domain-containing protein [archaeon]|nr:DUF87 domain-containing protein [archaeon]